VYLSTALGDFLYWYNKVMATKNEKARKAWLKIVKQAPVVTLEYRGMPVLTSSITPSTIYFYSDDDFRLPKRIKKVLKNLAASRIVKA